MSEVFPFAFDSSLAFYLVVYVLTWVLHVIFMAYVLAGSCVLAWATLFPGQAQHRRTEQPLPKLLRAVTR